jgi:hypothetical protein
MQIIPSKILLKYPTSGQPRPSLTSGNNGYINLKENDIIFSSFNGYSPQNILITDTGAMTAIINTSISSNSRYTYNLISTLLSRSLINKSILTRSETSYISSFKSITSSDLINDNVFKIGNSSIIGIKKYRFGENIRPLSFTANTSGEYTFFDSTSSNDTFGLLLCEKTESVCAMYSTANYTIQDMTRVSQNVVSLQPTIYPPYISEKSATTTNWDSFNNPSKIYSGSESPVGSGRTSHINIYNTGSIFAGISKTATITSTYNSLECFMTTMNGVTSDAAVIIKTSGTSITANAFSSTTGIGVYVRTNFTTPDTGTLTAYLVTRNSTTAFFDWIEIANTRDMTYCTWYKAPTLSTQLQNSIFKTETIEIVLNDNAINSYGLTLRYENGIRIQSLSASPISLNYLQNGNWHSIVTKIKANEYIKIFVDTILVASTAHSGSLLTSSSSDYTLKFAHQLGDANTQIGRSQVINGLLSENEITSIYNDGYSASYENGIVVADWKWKGNGNDFTGNGYTLTAFGPITYVGGPLQSATLTSSLAGIIFYDLGLIAIHGPDQNALNSLSALTSVNFYSTYKINSLNVFCTTNASELNYTSNENSFYNNTIISNPNDLSTSSYSNNYQWGLSATITSGKSNYYLSGLYNRNPYITTIGLYNDDNILLAIAKLAQPIKKPSSIPFTVKVGIDLQ